MRTVATNPRSATDGIAKIVGSDAFPQ